MEKGLVGSACFIRGDGEVGGDVIDPTFGFGHLTIDFKRAILIDALVDEAGGVLEAGAWAFLVTHVPFAEIGGAVSGVAQEGGVGDGGFRERRVVIHHAVDVGVLPGEETGAAG